MAFDHGEDKPESWTMPLTEPGWPAADASAPQTPPPARPQTPPPAAPVTPPPEQPGLEVQPDEGTDPSEAIVLRVTTQSSRLNMRSGPGTEYEVVGQADHGALVTKIGSLSGDQGWIGIECNGVFGWVSAQYLSPAE